MNNVTLVGLLAGGLTTASFLPQLWKSYQTHSARDLSLKMYSMYSMGVLLWLIYGLMIRDIAIIFWNGFALILAVLMLGMKLIFDREADRLIRDSPVVVTPARR